MRSPSFEGEGYEASDWHVAADERTKDILDFYTRAQRRRQAAGTEAAALRRARQDCAARASGTATAAPESAALRTTA